MERLYSIHSPNGKGFYQQNDLKLEKKTEDYYQFYIENDDESNQWYEYIVETKPGICCNCNRDLTLNKVEKDTNYKLLYPEENLFIFTRRRGDEYWYIYYHYCSDCMKKGLYNWSETNNRKYPILRYDGGYFVNMLKCIDNNIDIPENISFPRIYRCDYYLSNGYRYLDKSQQKYSEQENEMKEKLENMDIIDKY